MPPRIPAFTSARSLAFRPKPAVSQRHLLLATRSYSTNKSTDLPVSSDGKGPNAGSLPTVSEEASSLDKARGQSGPDLSQGTPIQEMVKDDPEAQKHLPKVMKDAIKAEKTGTDPSGKRSFSTSARRRELELTTNGPAESEIDRLMVVSGSQQSIADSSASADESSITLESQVDPLPALRPEDVFTRRYPAIIEQLVGLMMQHGKKAVAQKNVALILSILRTSPPPKLRTDRPLMPGHPPPSYLPLNPLMYLTLAIDSLAPVIRLRAQRGAAGGGASLMIPVPLAVRQRRRTAMMWIIDAASKRKDKTFPHRVADQIIAVVEGRSGLWDRRIGVHKLGVASRSNVGFSRNKRKKAM